MNVPSELHAATRYLYTYLVKFAAALATLVLLAAATPCRADEKPTGIVVLPRYLALRERPHTIAELELGILALPGAAISVANRGGSTPFGALGTGDVTPQLGVHVLYHAGQRWAVGSHLYFAPSPTTDKEYQVSEGKIRREHARSYFYIGGEGRYFPMITRHVDAYVGAAVGGIVIADRFTHLGTSPVPTILGTPTVTVRTEGLSAGLQFGVQWRAGERWIVGFNTRADLWVIPGTDGDPRAEQSCTAIGDCRTLSGNVFALLFGLSGGYRIDL